MRKKTQQFGFPTRSDTKATSLKFRIHKEGGLYYPCSKNEGPDQAVAVDLPIDIVGFLIQRFI